ncbi:MAG TPA: endonuclease MutS2 [Candidatus Binataceae bacterium]|nr:endonuclease MutS2 [Candidatus Binataceae bacterium]
MRERDLISLEFDKLRALLAQFAVSEPARARLHQLRPSFEVAEVRRRLGVTRELVDLRAHAGSLPIGEFVDQNELLMIAARQGATLDGVSLVQIRQFVLAARHLETFMRSRCERFPALAALARSLLAPKELADALLRALADDGGLLDDASRELKRLRTRLRDERLELEARMGRMLDSSGMAPFLTDHLVTLRNRRFVLPLRPNYAERLEGIVQDRSVSGETLFVEPLWAVELNNRLIMLERDVEAEERRILGHLTAMVRNYGTELALTFRALVELDVLNAQAIFAERWRCVEPEIVERGLQLINARHPLLVASGRTVVPINFKISPERSGMVISGPNTGGKTVALKTAGLLCLMAQSGLLVPASAGTRLMVFSAIFADIGDEQSIEADLSTFSAHIANLAEILRLLVSPALVILDEPGAGTDPAEGGALTIGLIEYLLARHSLCVIATHSTAVKLYAYASNQLESSAVDFDERSLTPRFTLKEHTIGQSFGLAVAQRLGLPAELIERARAAQPIGSAELEEAIRGLDRQRQALQSELQEMRQREQQRQQASALAIDRARQEEQRARELRTQLSAQFERIVADFRREGARVLDGLKGSHQPRRELGQAIRKAVAAAALLRPETLVSETFSGAPLKVGDQVELVDADIRGELLTLEPERAVIARGGMRIEVAPSRLRPARATRPDTPTFTLVNTAPPASAEVNLIGLRAPEALQRLESFLDQAYLTNQTEVRVVHGVGSGALRRAVHEYLRASPYCAEFHEAPPHGGGAGATIVSINL